MTINDVMELLISVGEVLVAGCIVTMLARNSCHHVMFLALQRLVKSAGGHSVGVAVLCHIC